MCLYLCDVIFNKSTETKLLRAVTEKLLKHPPGPLNLTGNRLSSPWRWFYRSQKDQPISTARTDSGHVSISELRVGSDLTHTHSQNETAHTNTHTLNACRCMISSSLHIFYPNHLHWRDFNDVCCVAYI